MKIKCTCSKTFNTDELLPQLKHDEGGNLAVYLCPRCMTKYLAVTTERTQYPVLYKLTSTTAKVVPE